MLSNCTRIIYLIFATARWEMLRDEVQVHVGTSSFCNFLRYTYSKVVEQEINFKLDNIFFSGHDSSSNSGNWFYKVHQLWHPFSQNISKTTCATPSNQLTLFSSSLTLKRVVPEGLNHCSDANITPQYVLKFITSSRDGSPLTWFLPGGAKIEEGKRIERSMQKRLTNWRTYTTKY